MHAIIFGVWFWMVLILFFEVRFPVGFEEAGALSACLSLQMALDAERRDGEEKKERESMLGCYS